MKFARIYRAGWGALLLTSRAAWASPEPPASPVPASTAAGAPAPAPPGDSLEAAEAAFSHAQELLAAGAQVEALSEFNRAYQIFPDYQVQYNIGGCNLQLGHWANARRAFVLYLELGGNDVPPERRAEVRGYLDELSQKTATLTLSLNVATAGAVVRVDGAPVESTEMTGLILEPGEHVVNVSKPGFRPLEQLLRATDGQVMHLVLPLTRMDVDDSTPSPQHPFGAPARPRLESSANDEAEPVSLWVPWTITGVLAAGWITTAGLAIKARHDRNIIERPETSAARIDDARRLHETLAVVSDVLLASTLASAGVSAYFTWWPRPDPASGGSGVGRRAAGGVSVGVSGRF